MKQTNNPLERLVDQTLHDLKVDVEYKNLQELYIPAIETAVICMPTGYKVRIIQENRNNLIVLIGKRATTKFCDLLKAYFGAKPHTLKEQNRDINIGIQTAANELYRTEIEKGKGK